jgi:hypothetical protein
MNMLKKTIVIVMLVVAGMAHADSALYEVLGSDQDVLSHQPWWDYYYGVGPNTLTSLGDGDTGTMSFNGTFNFYVIAVREKMYIDCIHGLPGDNELTTFHASGNASNWENLGGQPDGKYAIVGNKTNPGNFVGFLIIQNPGNWTGLTLFNVALPDPLKTSITKFTAKAGSAASTDSAQFAGLMEAAASDIESAAEIVISFEAEDLSVPLDWTFPLNATTFKKGKFSAKIGNTSFKYDPKNGKMSFSAKNQNLSKLSCPIKTTIEIGNHVSEMLADENVVNGLKKPCPPQFLMGVRNWMLVDKSQVKFGKVAGTDSFSITGYFAVADDYDKANPIVVTLGTKTYTVEGNLFSTSGLAESYSGTSQEGPLFKAKFDFAKGTYQIQVRNATIEDAGDVDFGINCFGQELPVQTVIIPS